MSVMAQRWPAEFAERYRRAGYWTGETFGALLRARAEAVPERTAVVAGATRWSYRDLDARADATAAGLLALGFAPGDRVVVQLPNIAELLSVAFGMFRVGIIPVFALPAHRSAEVTHIAAKSGAKGYVIAAGSGGFDYRTLAADVMRGVPSVERVIVVESPRGGGSTAENHASTFEGRGSLGEARTSLVGGHASSPAIGTRFAATHASLAEVEELGAGVRARSASRLDAHPGGSDVALVQLSGGSTGLPKLIPRTHDDYLYSVRRSAEICRLDGSTIYMGALPIAHNFPMSSPGVLGVIEAGGTVVLAPSPDPDTAFALIEAERVTITAVVPPLAILWLEAAAGTRRDLSSLEVLQVGGAKLTPEVARRVRPVLGARLQQVFGMAEGLVNYTGLDDPDDVVINTQGRPMCPDDEVLVLDDRDEPVPDGVAGHLLTRGPYTIRAYHDEPEANARAFTPDGFYRTGDVVRRVAGGYLVVEGRATDRINRGGEKISAEEIEDHLLAHPRVHDAAVIGTTDSYMGERTCAYVIPRGDAPRAAELRAWIRGRGLAEFKVPDQIVFVSSFPITGVGKTSRRELRAALRAALARHEGESMGQAASTASAASTPPDGRS